MLAPDAVAVRVLTDQATYKNTLRPAAERWTQQFGPVRPLEVRLATAKTLHDRLILVDGDSLDCRAIVQQTGGARAYKLSATAC